MTKPSVPVRYLLVDDLEENLIALEALLRRDNLVLMRAKSGVEALELLLDNEVALALIDVQMPGMDGFELAELMRGMERTRRVPIIFLTAGSSDWQRHFRGYEAGAVDFLVKPIEQDVLRSKAQVFYDLFQQRQEVLFQRDELRAATEENLRLLQESREQAEALQEADRRKDEFLAMLAHELRNPLAPVSNAVEILRLSGTTDPMIESARQIIARQVSHMSRMVDDLLDMARIARSKVQLRLETCDAVAIVRQTAADYEPVLAARRIALQVDLPDHPLMMNGDPTRLAQIIGNLLHNACKFTPQDGCVRVNATRDGDDAVIEVADNGVGMEPAIISRLFEPFVQADQSLDRERGGLGLGLALVRGLVELHHGTVTVFSEGPGMGCKFTIRLPLNARTDSEESQILSKTAIAPRSLRILAIEDNKDAAKTLQLLLKLMGHQVEVAFDGEAGLQSAQSFLPDVIISDLGLPGRLNGFAVAREIRKDPRFQSTHLVAMSGYDRESDRQMSVEAGFNEHLTKPVGFEHLQAVLNRL